MLASLRVLLKDRPYLVALLIGLAAQLLFTLHLDQPRQIMFDETHYVPAAKALLELSAPRNIEHPLLGKEIIAAGIGLFGDNPYGWRIFSTIAATSTVVAGFAFLWLLLGSMRSAVFGALLLAINHLVFIQARIGMLDVFLGAFVSWGLVLMLWAMRGTPRQVLWRWVGASILLGLAVAVKWAAVPYVALAGLAFIVLRRDRPARWPGLPIWRGLLILGLVSIPVYFLTFLPAFFYAQNPLTLERLIPFQGEMYALQTQVLAGHTYQSKWWSWPLMLRPIWYLYEPGADGVYRGVLLVGNPAIMWGGLVAVLACLNAAWRERAPRPLAVALLWIASVAIYIVIPKSLGFYYYYYLSSIFLCFVIATAFHHFDRGRKLGREKWFAAAALLLFVYFYPILSAAPLPDAGAYRWWTWFPGWV